MPLEIERKFLVKQLPEFHGWQVIGREKIFQTYIADDGENELRVRKVINELGRTKYTVTFKVGNGLIREEFEKEISKSLYEQMIGNKGVPLEKERLYIDYDGKGDKNVFEIDIYQFFGFMIAEVEFDSELEANEFNPPSFFGMELTGNKVYSNKNLFKAMNMYKNVKG